jgi:hypothetical protein
MCDTCNKKQQEINRLRAIVSDLSIRVDDAMNYLKSRPRRDNYAMVKLPDLFDCLGYDSYGFEKE